MKYVMINWVDTWSEYGWHSANSFEFKPIPCTSVGILIQENKESVSIAQSYGDMVDCRWGEVTNIPRCSIKKMRELK